MLLSFHLYMPSCDKFCDMVLHEYFFSSYASIAEEFISVIWISSLDKTQQEDLIFEVFLEAYSCAWKHN